jgi:type III secretory pathway component EscS
VGGIFSPLMIIFFIIIGIFIIAGVIGLIISMVTW